MATESKLISSFARFVQGDIKGGEHAQSYRKEIITTAVEQAFKGNYSPINEALTLTQGKAKKTRAYAAGFAALGPIGDAAGIIKVHYIGSLNNHDNKTAREEIAARTGRAVSAFFVAFDAVMAEKAAPRAAKPTAAPAPAPSGDAANAPAMGADEQRHAAAVALDDSVTAMETNLRAGMLTGEQTDRIVAALLDNMTAAQLRELADLATTREMDALKGEIAAAQAVINAAQAEPIAA